MPARASRLRSPCTWFARGFRDRRGSSATARRELGRVVVLAARSGSTAEEGKMPVVQRRQGYEDSLSATGCRSQRSIGHERVGLAGGM